MEEAANQIETTLTELSQLCQIPAINHKARNLHRFQDRSEKYSSGAQLAVLSNCPGVVSRLLNDRKQYLVASKVVVISRLLLKSLQEQAVFNSKFLELVKTQLAFLKATLLQHVDEVLAKMVATPVLVDLLTAFSILKTSSAAEVLRHFLFNRTKAVGVLLVRPTSETITQAIVLFNQTLDDVFALFPRRISDVLLALKTHTIVENQDVLALSELDLVTSAFWLPSDICGFIPWVQHDIGLPKTIELVNAWVVRMSEFLYAALESALASLSSTAVIVQLRAGVLRVWRTREKTREHYSPDNKGIINRFRKLIGKRLMEVTKSEAEGLYEVRTRLSALFGMPWHAHGPSMTIWDPSLLQLPLLKGAQRFRYMVASRVCGRNLAVKRVLHIYNEWLIKIELSAKSIRDLRNTDLLGDVDENSCFAMEELAQHGREDSDAAEKDLVATLDAVYRKLENDIQHIVTLCMTAVQTSRTANDETSEFVFILRCIRHIRHAPPKHGKVILLSLSWFCVDLIPKLHGAIAAGVITRPLLALETTLQKRAWGKATVAKLLWEGTPPLPVQPSSAVFKTLQGLVAEMSLTGGDVWTPAAANAVKNIAVERIWAVLQKVIEGKEALYMSTAQGQTRINKYAEEMAEQSEELVKSNLIVSSQRKIPEAMENDENAGADGKIQESDFEILRDISPTGVSTPSAIMSPLAIGAEHRYGISTAPMKSPISGPDNRLTAAKNMSFDWMVQLLFDVLYLDEAFHQRGAKISLCYSAPLFTLSGKVDSVIGPKVFSSIFDQRFVRN